MVHSGRAFALTGAALAALALGLAGCSTTGSSSSAAVTVSGNTLSIYISEPPNLSTDPAGRDVIDAEQLAYSEQAGEVKDYKLVKYTTAGGPVSYNARAAISDETAVAYLGEIQPGDSEQTAGITNAVDLLQVSPTDTALELGSSTPVVSGAPENYFESWSTYGRTFARVVPSSAQEAAFLVKAMLSLGTDKLYVADDGSDYGKAIAHAVTEAAGRGGITVVSTENEASAIFFGSQSPGRAAGFFNAAASGSPSATLFGSSSLDTTRFIADLSSAVKHLYISVPGTLPSHLNAQGKAFVHAFAARYGHQPAPQAIFGYAAMSAVLAVIKEAGANADNRTVIVKDFLKYSTKSSVLGSYSIDSDGDTSLDAFVLERLASGALTPVTTALRG